MVAWLEESARKDVPFSSRQEVEAAIGTVDGVTVMVRGHVPLKLITEEDLKQDAPSGYVNLQGIACDENLHGCLHLGAWFSVSPARAGAVLRRCTGEAREPDDPDQVFAYCYSNFPDYSSVYTESTFLFSCALNLSWRSPDTLPSELSPLSPWGLVQSSETQRANLLFLHQRIGITLQDAATVVESWEVPAD